MLRWWGDTRIMRWFYDDESYTLHPSVLTPTIFSNLGILDAYFVIVGTVLMFFLV